MENKTVLITGAAKRIGKAIAISLAEQNWSVAIHYHNSQLEAEETVRHIAEAGTKACIIQADLSDEQQLRNLFATANKKLGAISCLINNASVFRNDTIENLNHDSWQENMMVNLYAPTILSQEFVKQLPDGVKGNIINMLDYTVWRHPKNFVSYTASKAGLWALTKQLALTLAPNSRVNAIGPGNALANKHETDERFKKSYLASPLQVSTDPDEICQAIKFILSAKSMTGQMIALDSGKHLIGPEVY